MVIAATYDKETGNIGQHFGHAEWLKLYEIDEYTGEIVDSAVVQPYGQGHEMMVQFLLDYNTAVLVCQNIGDGALSGLAENNIAVLPKQEGPADNVIDMLIQGALQAAAAESINGGCGHHDGGHSCCGGHEDGGHSCCGGDSACAGPGSCCGH